MITKPKALIYCVVCAVILTVFNSYGQGFVPALPHYFKACECHLLVGHAPDAPGCFQIAENTIEGSEGLWTDCRNKLEQPGNCKCLLTYQAVGSGDNPTAAFENATLICNAIARDEAKNWYLADSTCKALTR